ncbi:hypothetical protein A9K58_00340 [Stenotrophomonas maltophilia]|uniref:Uncharacterized protein n=1 Tax=Stenotrophomonas maltophilia TaxID=40324 RepID=A0A1A6Y674_STEMA|nr:hypothetical protein [Stenotrophomonas maltophilia]OBU70435.1 hypothetical protein A9K58_00340 [Stenotrophomonas maltophilia]
MDAIEKRALDLLCGEIDLDPEDYDEGERIEAGEALRAIIAALTPPEGYVLVPVLPTYEMAEAMEVKWESGEGFPWRYAAMLAARPEVKP